MDIDGRLTGLVSVIDLTRCPPAERRNTQMRQLARPLPDELVLAPDAPLEQVLRHAPIAGGDFAVVVANDQVLGVLTVSDITRAVEIGALREIGLPLARGAEHHYQARGPEGTGNRDFRDHWHGHRPMSGHVVRGQDGEIAGGTI